MTQVPRRVGVIIVNWNNRRDTTACLEAVRDLDWPDLRVYLVDNGSTECSPAVFADEFEGLEIIANATNRGFAGGNNDGVRRAIHDGCAYVFLINNDALVSRGTVRHLVRVAESRPQVGMVGPKILDYHDPTRIQSAGGTIDLYRGTTHRRGEGRIDGGSFNGTQETGFCTGAALLMSAEMIKAIGLFDERYFLYHEDTDMCLRGLRAGFRLYYTGSTNVRHKESATTGGHMNERAVYYSTRNAFLLIRTHGAVRHRIVFYPYALLLYPMVLAVYSILSRSGGLIQSYVAALLAGLRHQTGPALR